MSACEFVYDQGDEDPAAALTWRDRDGNIVDLSTATFSVKLVNVETGTLTVTKTTGVTGAATAPNIVIAWAAGELNISAAEYYLIVTATVSSRQRTFRRANPPKVKIIATAA